MARVPNLAAEELTPEQKRIHDDIAATRSGTVRGPFALWLRTPEIADLANRLGVVLRARKLEQRLFELMVLVIARHWSAQYEWFAHEKHAVRLLAGDVIEAIRAGRKPAFAKSDEELVYRTVTELNETRTVSQKTYDRALAALGLERLIELVAAAGFYTMVAMTLNAFDAPVPGGERPLPDLEGKP